MLARVLSMLSPPRFDDGVIPRLEAVVLQCSLSDLNTIAAVVAKWVRQDPSYHHNTPSKFVGLLQTLNRRGVEILQTANRLDRLLEDLKHVSGEWFEEILLEETMAALMRMMDQINWDNVPEICGFLARLNYLCPLLMDRIASVVLRDIEKVLPQTSPLVKSLTIEFRSTKCLPSLLRFTRL